MKKKRRKDCMDQQTTQAIPLMISMRLPGEAALIVAGKELVVPRWHMHVAYLI